MSLALALWQANSDLAAAALAHPLVAGIGDGTLPHEVFAGFIAQDGFFLDTYARAYALGLAHSPDRDTLDAFAGLLAGARDELRMHTHYLSEWGVNPADVRPTSATRCYTDFLLATATLGGVALTCAAMAPCMRLYAHLGRGLSPPRSDVYAAWIATYADPGFERLAAMLERLLDDHAPDGDPVRDTYRRAMRLEVAFFDSALDRGAGPDPGQ